MKHYKTVVVPSRTEQQIDSVTCDLCKSEMVEEAYRRDDVDMECDVGDAYPEGGHRETTRFDLCSKCFLGKVVPWMRSQGAEPDVSKYDY